jgi:hypothetical protein
VNETGDILHPTIVVKIDARCEIEEIQTVSGICVVKFAPRHQPTIVPGGVGVFPVKIL